MPVRCNERNHFSHMICPPRDTILQGATSSNHHPDLICCRPCLLQPLQRLSLLTTQPLLADHIIDPVMLVLCLPPPALPQPRQCLPRPRCCLPRQHHHLYHAYGTLTSYVVSMPPTSPLSARPCPGRICATLTLPTIVCASPTSLSSTL
jgi:hypothetical protein